MNDRLIKILIASAVVIFFIVLILAFVGIVSLYNFLFFILRCFTYG